ncbi:MAG: gamma-glutamyl-gamma-aminobutyrate hydrolase family protein [Candidatus Poseidoniales archaeon]|jgi:putative glutamine amidotransferase|tara:strand:+ start:1594 stop:2280 length:687 start_codon:yes stop_codon:yes gene_type:complete
MRPLIGITTSVNSRDYEVSNQSVVMLPETYPKAVQRAGGIPLLLSECDDSEELLDCLDGLIISGGRDINPKLYNQDANQKTIDFSDSQDKWEASLIEGAIERDMPLLCICRGHQLLCVIRGGELFQDLPTTEGFEKHGESGGKWSQHIVKIEPDSLIHELLGDEVIGNSGHHQGVSDAGDLKVVGKTLDGLIEAVELDTCRFLISTQWHPEMLGQNSIFEGLIKASLE